MLTLAVDSTARPVTTPAPVMTPATTPATRPATTSDVKLTIKVILFVIGVDLLLPLVVGTSMNVLGAPPFINITVPPLHLTPQNRM